MNGGLQSELINFKNRPNENVDTIATCIKKILEIKHDFKKVPGIYR